MRKKPLQKNKSSKKKPKQNNKAKRHSRDPFAAAHALLQARSLPGRVQGVMAASELPVVREELALAGYPHPVSLGVFYPLYV